jgi:hypothetical protein
MDDKDLILGHSALETTNNIITALVVIIIANIIVRCTYRGRAHLVWTYLVPTVPVAVFILRVAINRRIEDLFRGDSWGATTTWAGMLIGFVISTIYVWWPFGKAAKRKREA